MELKVYVHRTKKHNFEVCEAFSVCVNFENIPQDKRNDIDFINKGFQNDVKRMVLATPSVKKYGTRIHSFYKTSIRRF